MAKKYFLVFFMLIFCFHPISCQVVETTVPMNIDESKSAIRTRFLPPKGYVWEREERGSFSEYLVSFPLYPPSFPIRDFQQVPIEKQSHHVAVLKIDVDHKDLQQCADAWIRLYSEYLWSQKRFGEIGFHFTSGQFLSWNDFRDGVRTIETGRSVRFVSRGSFDDSYANFRKYLRLVFQYAGTISLDKEGVPVKNNSDIKPGDFVIVPGSPGHCVIVVARVRNPAGKYLYLLAESFMPAQDIHILRNPTNSNISPWYELDVNSAETVTAKYIFRPTSIKRFYGIK
ncbi:DUF4846 domain-containing protein [Chryseobacterium koreense]|uniref:DUF4846 domain-containing protein n=1 Tax=Chryseobacterium koreense TaxID=232216 RepID=UPI0026F0D819|nr:DUF4846 domain-containing protein [Chryseobacterium koreense]